MARKKDDKKVDESSRESMTASDSPAWTSGGERSPGAAAKPDMRSLWSATAALPKHEPLRGGADVDVCVIGAGYAGLTAAYHLAKRGRKTIVVDSIGVAAGESSVSTAHHTVWLDPAWTVLERRHGAPACRLVAESHAAAIDLIEEICRDEKIACGLTRADGWHVLERGDSPESLRADYEAAMRCWVPGVSLSESAPPGFGAGPAIRIARQAYSDPVKYLSGLAKAFEEHGGKIYGGTRVESVADGEPATVALAGGGTIKARSVVVATNVPVNDWVSMHTRLYPYRTYAIALRVPRAMLEPALYWDTGEPYHYAHVVSLPACDLLIAGGEDHKTGQEEHPARRYGRIERWARERFPGLGPVEFAWSGQVIETPDGLAFIGRNPGDEHVYIVTGESGNGTTYGTIGGKIVADLITTGRSRFADVYSPSRGRTRGAPTWLRENLNAFSRYSEYVRPGDVRDEDDIKPGTGAVVRRGLSKVAAYRAEDGSLHEFSAVCPHLGGLVCWNDAEKTWDCPVHGSRFDTNGEPINGPASTPLRPKPEPAPRSAPTEADASRSKREGRNARPRS